MTVCEKIASGIKSGLASGAYSPGAGLPSIRRLAESFGASPRTVQKAVNGLKLEGFIASSPGRGLFPSRSERRGDGILFVTPCFRGELSPGNYAGNIFQMFRERLPAVRRSRVKALALGNMDAAGIIRELDAIRPSMLVMFEVGNDYLLVQLKSEFNLPMLSLDHDASRFGMPSVIHDNLRGASLAVGHLVSRGHRRILAVASGDYRRQGDNQFIDAVSIDRMSGYRLAMLERGLEPEIARLPSSWLPEFEKDLSAILKRRDFTAVFCPNNYVLKRVAESALAEGIKIPQDLSLVGFHHHQEYIGSRKVSYVKADMREMSARGAAYAKRMLEGKRPAFEPDVIGMELVKGETVVDMEKKRRAT